MSVIRQVDPKKLNKLLVIAESVRNKSFRAKNYKYFVKSQKKHVAHKQLTVAHCIEPWKRKNKSESAVFKEKRVRKISQNKQEDLKNDSDNHRIEHESVQLMSQSNDNVVSTDEIMKSNH